LLDNLLEKCLLKHFSNCPYQKETRIFRGSQYLPVLYYHFMQNDRVSLAERNGDATDALPLTMNNPRVYYTIPLCKIIAFRRSRNGDATGVFPIPVYKPRVYYTMLEKILQANPV